MPCAHRPWPGIHAAAEVQQAVAERHAGLPDDKRIEFRGTALGIGRASRQSTCVLIADSATTDAAARLNAIASTTDGFVIAEKDLEIRGPGELFGARQSGLAPFHVAELPRDLELLLLARRDARQWIHDNPTLAGDRDALLRQRLLKAHGKALGLGDVG